jgi:carbon-monoxide dehydrogenase iron sulfur subunit
MSQRRAIFSEPEKCTGCKICELVCSATKEGEFNPLLSRIRHVRVGSVVHTALSCRLCDDPTCVRACPVKALSQDPETGLVHVDNDKCTGCGWCIEACEFGAISLPKDRKTVIICDLCDGDPKCVEYCPQGALSLKNAEEMGQTMRKKAVANLLKLTE